MKKYMLSICLILNVFISCHAQNTDLNPDIELITAFPALQFDRPVDFQSPGDGSHLLFVVEQQGRIYTFENNPEVTKTKLFLDITDRVNDRGNEEGLLGLAFHPQFRTNGFFYLNYTADNPRRTVIARYRRQAVAKFKADASSEEIILEFQQPYSNHNGGQIRFGPDGYLYIAVGDGGSAGDPQNHAQNLKTFLGSILRIDVNRTAKGKTYGIPDDNPFRENDAGFREEIFAYGLRNPWRFSFDISDNRLWVADVGQNQYEEINIVVKGGNYGWNLREGFHPFRETGMSQPVTLLEPVWEYSHREGQSITGGFIYRGKKIPQIRGHYIYADYVSGKIWALLYIPGANSTNKELFDTDLNISSFGVDENNELFLCAFDGKIYSIQSRHAR